MSTYEVMVTRKDGAWMADVPAVPGAHTYARSLGELATFVREVIILMDDLNERATPEVTFSYPVSRYKVTAVRGAHVWVLQCQDFPGALTEVEELDQADIIREAIAFVAQVPEDSVEIDLEVQ